ncbi:MAG: HNH endonuclease [Mycolicibacterium sp.]|uniref:HNH endonuclease signature motif containing protein n=1 Tax=Mycolicibacterium sp. TaxID=2320850 RepID=UPI000FC15D91|nr:HNH endonuclease signature motif containing protein [Mycolicibacterium sp.]RUP30707.1 MAG: HNH endonuclease [Mycolicibacterium sp.]
MNNRYVRGKRGRTASDWRWRKLSQSIRREVKFCEVPRCPDTDLTVDHIIPIDEAPDLIYARENLRVMCRTHNGQRQDKCTDAEREQVQARIRARRQRALHYYQSQEMNC